jgi:hypothetical protein
MSAAPAAELGHQEAKGMKHLQLLARFLAAGGVLWGLFCLPMVLDIDSPLKVAMFAPGYLVTVGYFVRGFTRTPPGRARAIWGLSSLVQGAWLAAFAWSALTGRGFLRSTYPVAGWWGLSFIASVYGWMAEPRSRPA